MEVCHFSSVHSPSDIRIFIKECTSLAKSGMNVHYIVPTKYSYTKNGVNVHAIKTENSNRLNRMLITTKLIYQKCLEIDADVYHFHDPELIPIGLKLKKKGKIVIYDVHEDLPRSILSKHYIPRYFRKVLSYTLEKYENKSSKKFDYIICATPNITQRFQKINKNSVNVNNYPLLHELTLDNKNNVKKENRVCYVGGITSIRGIENIIEASTTVDGEIILAGPINTGSLERKINESTIKYEGILDRKNVNKLLNSSLAGLVLFLPEPNHINAQPNKMFEYMSAGIFVIASNFTLWKEIVEGNNCGICVNPKEVDEISKAIMWVFENKEKAVEMGGNGRRAVVEKYNWESESTKLINVYNGLSPKRLG